MLVKDFIKGKRIGHLECIELHKEIGERRMFGRFLCKCGAEKIIRIDAVFPYTSCGCVRNEDSSIRLKKWINAPENKDFMSKILTTHGMKDTSEYRIWRSMKSRTGPKTYGKGISYQKRGIKMCDDWRNSFKQFYADMGPRPSPKHSIDRIDNNGNYEPGNCRWATWEEQNNNTSRNVFLEYNGDRKTIRQWTRHFGLNKMYFYNRRKLGYDFKTTLNSLLCAAE